MAGNESHKRRHRDDDDVNKQATKALKGTTTESHTVQESEASDIAAVAEPQHQQPLSPNHRDDKDEVDFSIPGIRYATESWEGLKTTNEDRHVAVTDLFPGPVFGVFDGHGGTFTSDFLRRQLVKNVHSAVKQHVSMKAQDELRALRELSQLEMKRKRAIRQQMQPFATQQQRVAALLNDDDRDVSSKEEDNEELQTLHDQLRNIAQDMIQAIAQIDLEEQERNENVRDWYEKEDANFRRAINAAFARTDAQILQKNPSQDGSTALLVYFLSHSNVSELSYYTINLGDCRAVLSRAGDAIALTVDHKPNRPDEKQRILKAGGFVDMFGQIPRVYSAAGAGLSVQMEPSMYLAVSRAFGDRSLKTPTSLVSCVPEIKRFRVKKDDECIIIACDGVWDVLSNQDAVDIALEHRNNSKAAADAIVKAAYKKGSADNLTATVIQFGWKDGQDKEIASDAINNNGDDQAVDIAQGEAERFTAEKRDNEGEGNDNEEKEEEEIDMFNL